MAWLPPTFFFLILFIYLFRGFHQAQLHFTNIYNRYESKDEGSANGHEVPARQTPFFLSVFNLTFKTWLSQVEDLAKILVLKILFKILQRSCKELAKILNLALQ